MEKDVLLTDYMKNTLDSIAKWYNSPNGFKKDWGRLWNILSYYRFKVFKKYFIGESILELGFADGAITQQICKSAFFKQMIGIDGAKSFVEIANKKFSKFGFKGKHVLFEKFETNDKFDFILASHVLEHLDDRIDFLKKYAKFLKDKKSRFLIMVPNANSLHRQIGVKLGLLKDIKEFNDGDKKVGHKLVYTKENLINDVEKAGLNIIKFGGVFLKPLSNQQMENFFDDKLLDVFMEMGMDYPEISAEIYVVCNRK